jgi:hypothetical protein
LVTITHPHHPLFGQQVEIVGLRRGEVPDLILRLPDGTHAAIALSLTDASGPPAETTAPDPLPLLAIEGLRQAADLIMQWRQSGRVPSPAPRPSVTPSQKVYSR